MTSRLVPVPISTLLSDNSSSHILPPFTNTIGNASFLPLLDHSLSEKEENSIQILYQQIRRWEYYPNVEISIYNELPESTKRIFMDKVKAICPDASEHFIWLIYEAILGSPNLEANSLVRKGMLIPRNILTTMQSDIRDLKSTQEDIKSAQQEILELLRAGRRESPAVVQEEEEGSSVEIVPLRGGPSTPQIPTTSVSSASSPAQGVLSRSGKRGAESVEEGGETPGQQSKKKPSKSKA